MNIESINVATVSARPLNTATERVASERKNVEFSGAQNEKSKVAPEELLQQIKELTEGGMYSVRFERDERSKELVVKIVDSKTDEIIRQVPPEELLKLDSVLDDIRGNIVNTKS